ncbi:single-stranded DNA-binding protein [Sporosarcina sp. P17b]|uniref:single-stranded DNA-binding protein n=1 Tax=Sporosarcina sp. P17b TaxID=2048260 RepID=UPI000C16C19C|nr:single-stranded DNA-binding protein [Sporosarcina sp. P17b]PIC72503.1 single-stranded DNA-binding protein [Sporosarcina sp. P17b]
MNSVNLIGRWVREHEVIYGNTTVVKNTLAVDHPYKKDDASFIRVVMFSKTGELANQYTTKGSQVAVIGHIQTGSYEKSDGSKVYTTDVIASSIKFLEPRGNSSVQPNSSQQAPQPTKTHGQTNTQSNYQTGQGGQAGQQYGYDVPPDVTDDDLPF